jgi:hypothetical protein
VPVEEVVAFYVMDGSFSTSDGRILRPGDAVVHGPSGPPSYRSGNAVPSRLVEMMVST